MIDQQFAELQNYLLEEKGVGAELQRLGNGSHLVTVRSVVIRSGWNRPQVDVLFVAPPGYPAARPDCFWVSPILRLASGALPQNSNEGTPIPGDPTPGRPLTWFSWHLQTWDPNSDKLARFFKVVMQRLIPAR